MAKRNLLICFDAFGTLFKPRRPVAAQYAEVANSLGLKEITEDAVQTSFKAAFKTESKRNPNYGKAKGLNAEKWWSNIITNTFTPLLQPNQTLPTQLIPTLLHRFWSREGYELCKDVPLVLRGAKNLQNLSYSRVVVGVITNSDDRVPDILTSLGLKVSPLKLGAQQQRVDGHWDVDFSVTSYDVGHEKPDRRIFEAAEEMLGVVVGEGEGGKEVMDRSTWDKVYVGDEYEKDVRGAIDAGWNAVLIDGKVEDGKSDNGKPIALREMFQSSSSAAFGNMARFAECLR